LIFEKDTNDKQEYIGYVDFDYAGDLDKCRSTMGVCLHIVPSTGELAIDFTMYCRFVDNSSKVYDHGKGYK